MDYKSLNLPGTAAGKRNVLESAGIPARTNRPAKKDRPYQKESVGKDGAASPIFRSEGCGVAQMASPYDAKRMPSLPMNRGAKAVSLSTVPFFNTGVVQVAFSRMSIFIVSRSHFTALGLSLCRRLREYGVVRSMHQAAWLCFPYFPEVSAHGYSNTEEPGLQARVSPKACVSKWGSLRYGRCTGGCTIKTTQTRRLTPAGLYRTSCQFRPIIHDSRDTPHFATQALSPRSGRTRLFVLAASVLNEKFVEEVGHHFRRARLLPSREFATRIRLGRSLALLDRIAPRSNYSKKLSFRTLGLAAYSPTFCRASKRIGRIQNVGWVKRSGTLPMRCNGDTTHELSSRPEESINPVG